MLACAEFGGRGEKARISFAKWDPDAAVSLSHYRSNLSPLRDLNLMNQVLT